MKDKNFWVRLKKPILALAPLAGFTDSAFRQICTRWGAQVVYSEMVSATALFYDSTETLKLMTFNRRREKYFVVQLFGADPAHFPKAVEIISSKIKPDGIDLNCGCPVSKVIKQGAGADLMDDLKRSREIIMAMLAHTNLPISLKIRSKAKKVGALEFLENIADLDIKALMIHGRSLKQGFSGPIDADLIKAARRHFKGVILANGGINSSEDIKKVLQTTAADGVGIGRGALGNPGIFSPNKQERDQRKIFKAMILHAKLVVKLKGEEALIELRKHLPWYVSGLEGAAQLRAKLVKISSLEDLKKILR